MCRNPFSGTRESCFWLAYPLWNGTHYRKLPTRGFSEEWLCEREGLCYWSWGKQNVGFLLLVLHPICRTGWSNKWSDGVGGSVTRSNWNGGSPVLTSVWQMARCGAPPVAVWANSIKTKGLHFALDDIKPCKGEKSVFCRCCSGILL